MKDVFKQLLLEFIELSIPKGVRRNLQLPVLPPHVRKAYTFIGMRRSGKTSTWLTRGGFPEALDVSDWVHREILQNYIQVVIYRDIIERYQIAGTSVIERLLSHCLQNSATLLSINKIFAHFKSLGLRVSKNSLYEWLDYLEDAYCLFSVKCFDLSERKSSLRPRKMYPVDPGFVTAFAVHPEMKHAQTLEVAVFRYLREASDNVHYYVTQQGWEVDFLVQTPEGRMGLFQVCLSLKNNDTHTREVRALTQAMKELSLNEGMIITLEEEGEIASPGGLVRIIPAWKLFLRPKHEHQ